MTSKVLRASTPISIEVVQRHHPIDRIAQHREHESLVQKRIQLGDRPPVFGTWRKQVPIAADASAAYELTGANEKLAGPHVGHRVEISGMLKAAEVGAGGATGGATAGKPPKGVDVVSKDLKLCELEVTSVKMISANCSAQ